MQEASGSVDNRRSKVREFPSGKRRIQWWKTVPFLGVHLMVFGVIVFSGSLYALSVSGVRGFGAITPVGGLALLGGWLLLGLGAWKGQSG